jgi:hypothetical protein
MLMTNACDLGSLGVAAVSHNDALPGSFHEEEAGSPPDAKQDCLPVPPSNDRGAIVTLPDGRTISMDEYKALQERRPGKQRASNASSVGDALFTRVGLQARVTSKH